MFPREIASGYNCVEEKQNAAVPRAAEKLRFSFTDISPDSLSRRLTSWSAVALVDDAASAAIVTAIGVHVTTVRQIDVC